MKFRTYNCPCCDSTDITHLDAPDVYDDEMFIEVMCQKCGTLWKKHFYYDSSELIEEGKKMGASYEFEHELGKEVWVMSRNIPTQMIIFGHVLTATLHTYKEGLCEYTVRQDPHANIGELKLKGTEIFNTKAELIGSL